ncbi:O-methyltransferase [Penicillium argentinense]|uniref:O-methyltransferase n=1 Tax=Penicillium argentinense TaxID=1131581 RepID=A0A9W9KMZ6_9EURO|nr:O-methyltransferase [Penicillium argentinense]KAJ5112769.1 O-methyltransferase [Penicillium argentinense]
MANTSASTILDDIAASRAAFENNEPGSREALIDHSRALITALEIPSELSSALSGQKLPAQSAIIRLAVDVQLFQHFREYNNIGLTPAELSQKTGEIASPLLQLYKPVGQLLPFEAKAHNFFTPQPIHDFGKPGAFSEKGYSRVLLNEIGVSEKNPTLAATNMDMMMLAHLSVREKIESEGRGGILAQAGLKVVRIYNYPGVTTSLVKADLT